MRIMLVALTFLCAAYTTHAAVTVSRPGHQMHKRRPEMDVNGFYGDTFSGGFGDFWTARKRSILDNEYGVAVPLPALARDNPALFFKPDRRKRYGMDRQGFYGDTFSNGFGDFNVVKRALW